MQIEMVTREDLQNFKAELLQELKQFISAVSTDKQKTWLKGHEVRKLLKISAGTLQNLRVNGQLHPSKIGGSFYYPYPEIESLLEKGKTDKDGNR
ncbi:MAG: helix-turn-helix domain-containing protein [Taibaiella sp.]|jgi:hypothetical protein